METCDVSVVASTQEGLTVSVSGHLDARDASEVEAAIMRIRKEHGQGSLTIDATDLAYISSAGLRVLVRLLKREGALCFAPSLPYKQYHRQLQGIILVPSQCPL